MTSVARRIPVAVLLMAAWALLAVSCGGSEPSREEYGSTLRSTMSELQQAYGNAGDAMRVQDPSATEQQREDAPASVGDIVKDLEATQIALRDAGNRLARIEAPSDIDAAHEQLVAGVREMADDIDLLIEAQELAASDPQRAATLAREFADSQSFEQVRRAAAQIEDAGIDAGL